MALRASVVDEGHLHRVASTAAYIPCHGRPTAPVPAPMPQSAHCTCAWVRTANDALLKINIPSRRPLAATC